MEGAVILHETLHELHSKKGWVIFKIDFEKPYNKVNWSFFTTNFKNEGFSQKWCEWVKKFTQGVMSILKLMIN
jgi:hypothetical protein